MAKNLRAKVPESDTLVIHDRNGEATSSFMREIGVGKEVNIEVANTPRQVAEKSVSGYSSVRSPFFICYDEYVLSMI